MENMLRGSLTSTTDAKGVLGFKGERGYSAYEIAVLHGYEGTEQDWIDHFGLDLTDYIQTSDVIDSTTSTSTSYPLSANQGKNLKDNIDTIEDAIGDLTNIVDGKGETYQYSLNPVSGSPAANTWSLGFSNFTTDILPKGRYLVIFSASILSSGNGMITFRYVMDGTPYNGIRATIPLMTSLTSSGQFSVILPFNTDTTHTVNIELYGSTNYNVNVGAVTFIRLK
jgi:hypothetical protein